MTSEDPFFTSSKFESNIKDLLSNFDQVFVCSGKVDTNLGLIALERFKPSLVLIAGLRSTKKLDIRKLKINQPVDLLFHD